MALLITVIVLLLLLALGSWLRRRRKARLRADAPSSERGQMRPPAFSADDRRIRRAEILRDALITAFGPGWIAKTTEEIAADPALRPRLGPEQAERVVSILAEADRAKFAGRSAELPGTNEGEDQDLADLISSLTSPRPVGRPADRV